MSDSVALNPLSSMDDKLDSLVADASSELLLSRWVVVFGGDVGQAQYALARIHRCVDAIKRIRKEAEKVQTVPMTEFSTAWEGIEREMSRLKRFHGLRQGASGHPTKFKQPKKSPHIQFSRCMNAFVESIDNLGALFGLSPTQLNTVKINGNRMVVKPLQTSKPLKQLPDPVPTDAVALENLATDISAVAPAVAVDDDAQPTQERINDQVTINACARSVNTMAEKFHARKDKVDKNIVVPAFALVRSALEQIKRDAASKVKLSAAIDQLVKSVAELASLHHITDTSTIHLPVSSDLVDADRVGLFALSDDIREAAAAARRSPNAEAVERSSIVNACALSVDLIAIHVTEKVDPTIVDDALIKVREFLERPLWLATNAARLRSFVSSVRNLAIAHKIENIDDINLPTTASQPKKKKHTQDSVEHAESNKRAREASVAKAFDFGRWGLMSERRANIYGLL